MLNTKTRKSRKSTELYSFAVKQSIKASKQLPQLQNTVRYKSQIIPEADKNFSEISEFSYLALGQIRKHGNLGKIFLSFRNDLNFMSNYDSNGSNCFHAFLDCFRAKE